MEEKHENNSGSSDIEPKPPVAAQKTVGIWSYWRRRWGFLIVIIVVFAVMYGFLFPYLQKILVPSGVN